MNTASRVASAMGRGALRQFQDGPLSPFLAGDVLEVGERTLTAPKESQQTVFAGFRLQYTVDYRAALQEWFRAVAVGGHLVVVVSHAFLHERQLALPSRWDADQRRLYTPRSLMDEVEEALAPNTYRVRLLSDDDDHYDYELGLDLVPTGHSDILLALEKIAPPAWEPSPPILNRVKGSAPDYGSGSQRTRVETATLRPAKKIVILKLDHLGDFIMGLPALQRTRRLFADAEITLVVGEWNAAMASASGVADHVLSFNAFPRNSSEEEVDVHARAALFQALVPDTYDMAIDLRVDHDTRLLLRKVNATLRAGIGTRAQFPFLDIFLPVDFTRNEPETAREEEINHHAFASQGSIPRNNYRIQCVPEAVERNCAIIWGPYRRLRPGRYLFDPYLEITDAVAGGMVSLDIALNTKRVREVIFSSNDRRRLDFVVEEPDTEFEFRVWTAQDAPPIGFNFYGGRLVRLAANSVLHQTEYMGLLIELIRMRVEDHGVLGNVENS